MKFVAYYRLSKQDENSRGLGLDAQKHSVRTFIKENELIGEFEEIETGTSKRKRIKIYEALQLCKDRDATLIIARLDRLARDTVFLADLKRSKIPFTVCDHPHITQVMIDVMMALAEEEARNISIRTKNALAARRRKGLALGNPKTLTKAGRDMGAAKRREMALNNEANLKATDLILDLRERGFTFKSIADRLNKRNDRTSTGKSFTDCAVYRLYTRAQDNNQEG
jgi:DNA invertase Pin-like site-specific DNA recombinase